MVPMREGGSSKSVHHAFKGKGLDMSIVLLNFSYARYFNRTLLSLMTSFISFCRAL